MVGWQEKKVLSTVPGSSFFSGFGNQVKRFAGQAYGAVDRSVGGVLPGGADNQYIGKSRPYFSQPTAQPNFGNFGASLNAPKRGAAGAAAVTGGALSGFGSQPSPFEKDLGRAVNTGAKAIANVQPVVKNLITSSPDFVQNAVSTGLNNLPVSANLFGRYYTGLGSKGLELPSSFINEARTTIQENVPKTSQELSRLHKGEQTMQNMLGNLRQGNIPSQFVFPGMDKEALYQSVNDSLAENKSRQNQLRAGNVAVNTAMDSASSKNPLTSLGTSLGSAWFKPTPDGGWTTKEKYDFVYAGDDKKQPPTVSREEVISPSQNFSNLAASNFLNKFNQKQRFEQDAAGSPAAFFGRAVVAKMDPTSFEYDINIPRR